MTEVEKQQVLQVWEASDLWRSLYKYVNRGCRRGLTWGEEDSASCLQQAVRAETEKAAGTKNESLHHEGTTASMSGTESTSTANVVIIHDLAKGTPHAAKSNAMPITTVKRPAYAWRGYIWGCYDAWDGLRRACSGIRRMLRPWKTRRGPNRSDKGCFCETGGCSADDMRNPQSSAPIRRRCICTHLQWPQVRSICRRSLLHDSPQ